MRSFIILVIFVLISGIALTQEKTARIEYLLSRNGKQIEASKFKLIMEYQDGIAKIWHDNSERDLIPEVPKQVTFIDYNNQTIYRHAIFQDKKKYFTVSNFDSLKDYKPEGKVEKILGYDCQKYVGTSFSNTIEIWVATDLKIKGSPSYAFTSSKGVVLKLVRNGNFSYEAFKVELETKSYPKFFNLDDLGSKINDVAFRNNLANAFVKEVNVFTKQQINWTDDINNPKKEFIDSVYRYAGGTVVLKKLTLPVVPEGTTVFAEITEQSIGDAYDRTGSVFIIPTDKKNSFLNGLKNGKDALPKYLTKDGEEFQGIITTNNYNPIIELVRFFTPFGVHHFNNKRDVGIKWADAVKYKQDISDLLPVLQNEVWIGAFIGNYDKGGHRLSLKLKYHLNEQEIVKDVRKKYWIQPVFTTTNVMEMAGQNYSTMFKSEPLSVTFNVPKNVRNVSFRYISTGHGGWVNGDEYNQKLNTVTLNDNPILVVTPWRTDCGRYRVYNPSSGNFWNGISSSDGSRSGWCPGTVSHPYFVNLGNLKAGKHQIQVNIELGKPEGSSFSAWNVSGLLIGEVEE